VTADQVLAAVPTSHHQLLYARVDLVSGPDGRSVLMELELTEPQLYLRDAPGSADRMAAAIEAQLQPRGRVPLRPLLHEGRPSEHEGGLLWHTA
jgi:hypothetical protein